MKIWNFIIMKIWKYENIQISKYTNIYGEKNECKKCKRVWKESTYIYIYIHMKNFKVRSNQDFNNERNKQDKEKIFNKNKYIGISIKIYKDIYIYIYTKKYTNI